MSRRWIMLSLVLLAAALAVVLVLLWGSPPEPDDPRPEETPEWGRTPSLVPAAEVPAAPSKAARPGAQPPVAAPPTAAPATPQRVTELVRRAQQAYVRGDYLQTMKLANQALDLQPNHAMALRVAGAAACAQKLLSNAQLAYNRLAHSPTARGLLVKICASHGVVLATGAPPASGPSASPAPAGAAASGSGTGAGFDEGAGSGEGKAGKPRPVSTTALQASVHKVRTQIADCLAGKKGMVQVRITVAGSGKVTAATTLGQHAGSDVGGCVEGVVRSMTFPPFDGPPRTIDFPFIMR